MVRFVQQSSAVNDLMLKLPLHEELIEAKALLELRNPVSGFATADCFETEELQQFLELSQCITSAQADGSEPLPGEFIKPVWDAVELPERHYNFLLDFYRKCDNGLDFQPLFVTRKWNTVRVDPRVIQFGRLRLGSEIFGASVSPMHERSSFVLVNWIQKKRESGGLAWTNPVLH